MPRRPHDLANINLRIRESLRAKIEREAKRHHFSLNNEIRIRLEDSLARDTARGLDDIAYDLKVNYARLQHRYQVLELGDALAAAVLAPAKWEDVAQMAREWQHLRGLERRLPAQGGVS
jgi:hypothetical protein